LTARKARDTITATLLTTLIGEAEMIGKSAGNRESTDEEVLTVIKKFEKNMLENYRIYTERGMTEHQYTIEVELGIIRCFMPAKLTDEQVKADIKTLIEVHEWILEQKTMGKVVAGLKPMYGDQFDGQQVSGQFKAMLV
jgi:uncharacterized protein YqeY